MTPALAAAAHSATRGLPTPHHRPSARFFSALPAHEVMGLPALSPTMSSGNIVEWKKNEGDEIKAGDVLCIVETDKSTIEWEAQEDGYLAKILAPAGTEGIEINSPVCVVCDEAGDVSAFASFTPGAAPASSPAPATAAAATPSPSASASGASFPAHEVAGLPALSPTMSSGNIVEWKKNEGDEIKAGDVLCIVETDKSTIEWEAQEDSVLAKILAPAGGEPVDIGSPVAVFVDDAADVAAFASFTVADAAGGGATAGVAEAAPASRSPTPAPPPTASPTATATATASAASASAVVAPGARVIASPYAKALAAAKGASLVGVPGSGPGGRIIAADVANLAVDSGPASSTGATAPGSSPLATATGGSASEWDDVAASTIRKVVARRLLESKQTVPHYYLSVDVRMDDLMATRAQLNASLEKQKRDKLSVNDFVIKAAALALREVPDMNAAWHGDFIRKYKQAHISVAVQTDIGLLVPVVRMADAKGLEAIHGDVRALADKAKGGGLTPAEMEGGTFTISNLGMFGIKNFAAVVNPPQAGILAVGASRKEVVADGKGGYKEASVMSVTLSADHRVVDGAVGALWLQAFKRNIETPLAMLL